MSTTVIFIFGVCLGAVIYPKTDIFFLLLIHVDKSRQSVKSLTVKKMSLLII